MEIAEELGTELCEVTLLGVVDDGFEYSASRSSEILWSNSRTGRRSVRCHEVSRRDDCVV